MKISKYSNTTALILACIGFIGIGGIHRLYVGKMWTGLIWLFTFGLVGIGTIVDVISIARKDFTDSNGNLLK